MADYARFSSEDLQDERSIPDQQRLCQNKAERIAPDAGPMMKIGFKGTMNALFLKGLALKTRRGLLGQVERGKMAGGLSYGYPNMAEVFQRKVTQLAAALAHQDEALREAARSALRGFIDRIEIPAGDGKLMVFGDLGRMLATAAGERDGSALAAVAQDGCGGRI